MRRLRVNAVFRTVACHDHCLLDKPVVARSIVMVLVLLDREIKTGFNILRVAPYGNYTLNLKIIKGVRRQNSATPPARRQIDQAVRLDLLSSPQVLVAMNCASCANFDNIVEVIRTAWTSTHMDVCTELS